MSFDKITEKLLKMLEETEELTLKDFELIGEHLEFQVLPGIGKSVALSSQQALSQIAAQQKIGPAEWIETIYINM